MCSYCVCVAAHPCWPVCFYINWFNCVFFFFICVFVCVNRHTCALIYLLMVLDQNFYHNVLELDVHDGRHCLLLWAKQGRPEDHAQVGDGHQILLVVTGDTVEENENGTEDERLQWAYERETNKVVSASRRFRSTGCDFHHWVLDVTQPSRPSRPQTAVWLRDLWHIRLLFRRRDQCGAGVRLLCLRFGMCMTHIKDMFAEACFRPEPKCSSVYSIIYFYLSLTPPFHHTITSLNVLHVNRNESYLNGFWTYFLTAVNNKWRWTSTLSDGAWKSECVTVQPVALLTFPLSHITLSHCCWRNSWWSLRALKRV